MSQHKNHESQSSEKPWPYATDPEVEQENSKKGILQLAEQSLRSGLISQKQYQEIIEGLES